MSKEKQTTAEGIAVGEKENPCSRECVRGEGAAVQGK